MKKKSYTYKDLHNKAVTYYHKFMSTFIILAILNFVGVLLSLMRGNNDFFPSMISNILIFRLLSNVIENGILFYVLIITISILFSSIFIIIWSLSKNGNIKAIISGAALYLVDSILLFIFYIDDSYLIPQLFLHVIIIILMVLGIVNYYHILAIERKFKGSNERNY